MAGDILTAMDAANSRLSMIDESARVLAWAESNSYAGSRNEAAKWIVAASLELTVRENAIRELLRKCSEGNQEQQ